MNCKRIKNLYLSYRDYGCMTEWDLLQLLTKYIDEKNAEKFVAKWFLESLAN